MTGFNIMETKTERWITQIQGGVVTLVQRVDAEAFVVRVQDLPRLAGNEEIVSDSLARDILRAIGKRRRLQYGSVEADWPVIEQG